jgi:hypothetical protein
LEKSSNIKFQENPFSGSRAVICGGRADSRRTDTIKLIVAFRNFSNAPKTVSTWSYTGYYLILMGAFYHHILEECSQQCGAKSRVQYDKITGNFFSEDFVGAKWG